MLTLFMAVLMVTWATGPDVRPLELYEQWSGFNSGYPGTPTYQFVRDYETWKSFWARHKPDEFMPQIDLNKMQVFIWCPGPVLGGELLVEVLRFYKDNEGLTLVVRTETRRDFGAWQAPYLIAFLEKTSGNIRIMRPGNITRREAPLMPLFFWQDMGLPSVYEPVTVTLQAPNRPVKAWRNPWELEIPSPQTHPAWAKGPSQTPVEAAKPKSKPFEPPQTSSDDTPIAGSKLSGQSEKPADSTAPSTTAAASKSTDNPTDTDNTSGADPLQDPFNLDF